MVSRVRTTLRYDGPALRDHEMDVQDLAPALLALADIIQAANRKFNGDAAKMRVLVDADVEQRCFQLDIHLVQSVLQQTKALLADENVKTAKEIAEWVGIIGGAAGGAWGLFALIKKLFGQPEGGTTFQVTAAEGSTVVILLGDGNTVEVERPVYELAKDPAIAAKVKSVLRPLEKPGYDTLAFLEGPHPVFEVSQEEAKAILSAPIEGLDEAEDDLSRIRCWVRIKTPQYEGSARWVLMHAGRAIDAVMADDEWLSRFQNNLEPAPPNSSLDVEMEMRVPINERGEKAGSPSFKVVKVHEVKLPPPAQPALFAEG